MGDCGLKVCDRVDPLQSDGRQIMNAYDLKTDGILTLNDVGERGKGL